MTAYFNLNNNEVSKKLLVNKFNILNNQGRVMVNDQKISLLNEPNDPGLFRSSHRRCSVKRCS